MREVNPLDLVETIREGTLVPEPDRTISLANRSFCHTFRDADGDGRGQRRTTEYRVAE
jgi:hypothetical protein